MNKTRFSKQILTEEIIKNEKINKEKVEKENASHGSVLFPCAYYDIWLVETYPAINLHWQVYKPSECGFSRI